MYACWSSTFITRHKITFPLPVLTERVGKSVVNRFACAGLSTLYSKFEKDCHLRICSTVIQALLHTWNSIPGRDKPIGVPNNKLTAPEFPDCWAMDSLLRSICTKSRAYYCTLVSIPCSNWIWLFLFIRKYPKYQEISWDCVWTIILLHLQVSVVLKVWISAPLLPLPPSQLHWKATPVPQQSPAPKFASYENVFPVGQHLPSKASGS